MAARSRPRKAGEQPLAALKVNGKLYQVFRSRLTAVDIGDLRRATGGGMNSLLRQLADDVDLDTIAAVMWLSRRQAGEPRVRFEDVADEVDGAAYETASGAIETEQEPDDGAEDEASPET